MQNLFSHAQPPTTGRTQNAEEKVTLERCISLSITDAVDAFVDYVHLWWPQRALRFEGEDIHLAFSAGEFIADVDAHEYRLGTVTFDLNPDRVQVQMVLKPGAAGAPALVKDGEVTVVWVFESAHNGAEATLLTVTLQGIASDVKHVLGVSASEALQARASRATVVDAFVRFTGPSEH